MKTILTLCLTVAFTLQAQSPAVLLFGRQPDAIPSTPPVSGYTGWWVADLGTETNRTQTPVVPAVNNGDIVRCWRDQSGNTNDLFCVHASDQFKLTNNAANGHRAILQDVLSGAARLIIPTTNRMTTDGNGFTVIAAAAQYLSAPAAFGGITGGFDAAGRWDHARRNNTINTMQGPTTPPGCNANCPSGYTPGTNYVWTVAFDRVGGKSIIFQNLSVSNSTACTSTLSTTNGFNIGGLYGGDSPANGGNWWGPIYEVLYYPRLLTFTEISNSVYYLTNKYAIP